MLGIKVEITRFVDGEGYPGIVECALVDAKGETHVFHEKIPVVALKDLDENSTYPSDGLIACEVVDASLPDHLVRVSTELPWHIESTTEKTEFELRREQLREFGPGDFKC